MAPALAATTGSEIIRPQPAAKDESASFGSTEANFNQGSNGDIIRSVNAGSTKSGAPEAEESTRKNASVRKTKTRAAGSIKVSKKSSKSRSSYSSLIKEAARKHGVPLNIAHAVVQVESNFNPGARGSAGEVGLMQIKPATARGLGYRGSVKGLYDPQTNLEWGMRYLAGAHKRASGDVCGTILRYNAGHYAKRMNPVSRRYCQKVKQILASS
ncbi:lytic transglycosylase domain-containing protein [Roseibium sp.]|uniref:lytic transglycosylase domain-containing protein n=1 Tax=Roseibium sp. TaxID=1936156 RepID=UPI003A96B344